MRSSNRLLGTALVAFAACTGGRSTHGSTEPRSNGQGRDVFNPYICAAWSTEAGQWSAEFMSSACHRSDKPSCASKAVDRARQIVPLGNLAYARFYKNVDASAPMPKEEADRLARESFWSDPTLERAILLSSQDFCGTDHSWCTGCARPASSHNLTITWDSFRPYIMAYLWPVQRSPGSEIELYACSEVNGAGGLEGPESLRQAGFLVAMGFAEDDTMFVALQTLVQDRNRSEERSVPTVTRAIEEFLERPEARRHVCRTLDEARWFTSIAVEECSSPLGSGATSR